MENDSMKTRSAMTHAAPMLSLKDHSVATGGEKQDVQFALDCSSRQNWGFERREALRNADCSENELQSRIRHWRHQEWQRVNIRKKCTFGISARIKMSALSSNFAV